MSRYDVLREEMLTQVDRYTESRGHIRQRWIGLRVRCCWPEIGWGVFWATLCGSLAAGVFFRLDLDSALKLVLVLIAADPLMANLGHLVCDLDWSGAGNEECLEGERRTGAAPRLLPYVQAGSPFYRIVSWFERTYDWYTTSFCPQAGWMLSSVIFQGLCTIGIGLVLGSSVLKLLILGLILIALSVLLRSCCLDVAIGLRALAEVGVMCLVGYLTFAPWSIPVLGLAAVFVVLYGAALHAAKKGLDGTVYLLAVAMLALPIGCIVLQKPFVAVVLGVGCVFPIWLSWYAVRRALSAKWYFKRIGPYLLGLTLVASVALGLGSFASI